MQSLWSIYEKLCDILVRKYEGKDMPKDIPQIALLNRDINFFICYCVSQGKRSCKKTKAKTYILTIKILVISIYEQTEIS